MHFQILIEDISGKRMLDILMRKIITENDTFDIKAYKGIGALPKGMTPKTDASNRILLDNVPRLIQGYGKAWQNQNEDYPCVLILICDLDNKNESEFLDELNNLLRNCQNRPETYFCLAIEEGEAWLLGDLPAIRKAYPKAKMPILRAYRNDSICGTWEKLADAIYPGGCEALKKISKKQDNKKASGLKKLLLTWTSTIICRLVLIFFWRRFEIN